MYSYVNLNGKLIREDKAQISIHDQAYLFGYGLFETIRVYEGQIPFFKEHMKRFERGIKALKIKSPYSKKKIFELIQATLKKNKIQNASVRIILSPLSKNIEGQKSKEVNFLILTRKAPQFSDKYYSEGIDTWIIDEIKVHHDDLSLVKMTSYARLQYAREIAKKKKVFEVILKDEKERPVECSSSSLFMVNAQGHIIAPPLNSGILPGITRQTVLDLAKALKIKTKEKNFSQKELLKSSEAFISSSLKGVMPIKSIQAKKIQSPGPVTQKLMAAFQKKITQP